MADLEDSFLRALLAHFESRYGMSVVLGGQPWTCCPAARSKGAATCTCWIPVYDHEQAGPDPRTIVALLVGDQQPPVRKRMCGDCAYRPDSPERSGDEAVAGDTAELERLAATGTRFWCHDGMRQPIAWRHPRGMRIPAVGAGDYQPPIVEGFPFRADGTPGLLCAGWDARRRAIAARGDAS